jgi:hypothetical protein
MAGLRRKRFGWIPDLPDRRDKLFSRAVAHLDDSVTMEAKAGIAPRAKRQKPAIANAARPILQAPIHTFEGWRLSATQHHLFLADLAATEVRDNPASEPRHRAAMEIGFSKDRNRPSLLLTSPPTGKLPERIDLQPFMSPIEDQGQIGSCTAQTVIGLVEYLQISMFGQYVDASRLFLYKATRDLLQLEGDSGAYIRETIKAAAMFGVCPEQYWEYREEAFDDEPSAFCYSFAANYKRMSYYRLQNLDEIKRSIAQGYPVALGFTCYESIDGPEVSRTGIIPYPVKGERVVGGHAVLAVGYADDPDAKKKKRIDEGGLIIRNSWGTSWGADGYGFLPYSYILGGHRSRPPLSEDYWTMTMMDVPTLTNTSTAPYLLGNPGWPPGGGSGGCPYWPC